MSITYEEFMDRLAKSDSRISANIRNILVRQSLKMEASAKRNATYFPRVQTGRLRNSIMGTVAKFGNDEFLMLRAGGFTAPSRPFSESADVVYAAIQEYGGGLQRIKEKRYLRNAWDRHIRRTENLVDKAFLLALQGKSL